MEQKPSFHQCRVRKFPFQSGLSLSSQPREMKSSCTETGPHQAFIVEPMYLWDSEQKEMYDVAQSMSQLRIFKIRHFLFNLCVFIFRTSYILYANQFSCKLTVSFSAFWQFQAQTMSQGTALFSCGLMGESHTHTCKDVMGFRNKTPGLILQRRKQLSTLLNK